MERNVEGSMEGSAERSTVGSMERSTERSTGEVQRGMQSGAGRET